MIFFGQRASSQVGDNGFLTTLPVETKEAHNGLEPAIKIAAKPQDQKEPPPWRLTILSSMKT